MALLPNELLDRVCLYLPADDLCTVATASPSLCAVAQRILYRHVALAKGKFAVALTLASKPHLARHVRVFELVVDSDTHLLPAYYRAVSTALAHMPQLVSLSLTIPPHLGFVLPTDASFPRLRLLQAPFALDPHLVRFLHTAPAIVALTLDEGSHVQSSEIPPTTIPHLSCFTGSSQAAQALIPSRPVSSIFLSSGDLTEEVVSALAQSSAAVSTLDATTTLFPLPILEALSVVMPKLENIRLTTTYNLWDEFFNTPFIHNIKNALVAMDHLKSANVSGMLWKWLNKDGRVLTNEPHIPSLPLDNDDDLEWTYDNHNTFHYH